jgi:hypothetical protein
MLVKLARLSLDKWWCTPAWLRLSYLSMTEPTTPLLIQVIFILTFLPFVLHLMTSTWTFFLYLECQSPSHHQFLHKLSRINHVLK